MACRTLVVLHFACVCILPASVSDEVKPLTSPHTILTFTSRQTPDASHNQQDTSEVLVPSKSPLKTPSSVRSQGRWSPVTEQSGPSKDDRPTSDITSPTAGLPQFAELPSGFQERSLPSSAQNIADSTILPPENPENTALRQSLRVIAATENSFSEDDLHPSLSITSAFPETTTRGFLQLAPMPSETGLNTTSKSLVVNKPGLSAKDLPSNPSTSDPYTFPSIPGYLERTKPPSVYQERGLNTPSQEIAVNTMVDDEFLQHDLPSLLPISESALDIISPAGGFPQGLPIRSQTGTTHTNLDAGASDPRFAQQGLPSPHFKTRIVPHIFYPTAGYLERAASPSDYQERSLKTTSENVGDNTIQEEKTLLQPPPPGFPERAIVFFAMLERYTSAVKGGASNRGSEDELSPAVKGVMAIFKTLEKLTSNKSMIELSQTTGKKLTDQKTATGENTRVDKARRSVDYEQQPSSEKDLLKNRSEDTRATPQALGTGSRKQQELITEAADQDPRTTTTAPSAHLKMARASKSTRRHSTGSTPIIHREDASHQDPGEIEAQGTMRRRNSIRRLLERKRGGKLHQKGLNSTHNRHNHVTSVKLHDEKKRKESERKPETGTNNSSDGTLRFKRNDHFKFILFG